MAVNPRLLQLVDMPGPHLDRAIAEDVMGWSLAYHGGWVDENNVWTQWMDAGWSATGDDRWMNYAGVPGAPIGGFNPSTNLIAAEVVIERMHQLDFRCDMHNWRADSGWVVTFTAGLKGGKDTQDERPSRAHAICSAAIVAVMSARPALRRV